MSKRTGNKWRTDECGRCHEAHNGYSGKLDSAGVEYVVCGVTHKRMDVVGAHLRNSLLYPTLWTLENAELDNG